MLYYQIKSKVLLVLNERWIQIDRSGFFPKEEETEIQYILAYHELAKRFSHRYENKFLSYIQAKKRFYSLFQAIPCWVKSSFSKEGMIPWELAVCWQDSEGSSTLHLHPSIQKESQADIRAILLHELVHAARARLESSCFEEIIASEVMKTEPISLRYRMRAALSKVCLSTHDSLSLLVWHVLLIIAFIWGNLSLEAYVGLIAFFWLGLTGRSFWLSRIWKKAFLNIQNAFPRKGWACMLRATDRDVFFLANLAPKKVVEEIEKRTLDDWRWCYLSSCVLLQK